MNKEVNKDDYDLSVHFHYFADQINNINDSSDSFDHDFNYLENFLMSNTNNQMQVEPSSKKDDITLSYIHDASMVDEENTNIILYISAHKNTNGYNTLLFGCGEGNRSVIIQEINKKEILTIYVLQKSLEKNETSEYIPSLIQCTTIKLVLMSENSFSFQLPPNIKTLTTTKEEEIEKDCLEVELTENLSSLIRIESDYIIPVVSDFSVLSNLTSLSVYSINMEDLWVLDSVQYVNILFLKRKYNGLQYDLIKTTKRVPSMWKKIIIEKIEISPTVFAMDFSESTADHVNIDYRHVENIFSSKVTEAFFSKTSCNCRCLKTFSYVYITHGIYIHNNKRFNFVFNCCEVCPEGEQTKKKLMMDVFPDNIEYRCEYKGFGTVSLPPQQNIKTINMNCPNANIEGFGWNIFSGELHISNISINTSGFSNGYIHIPILCCVNISSKNNFFCVFDCPYSILFSKTIQYENIKYKLDHSLAVSTLVLPAVEEKNNLFKYSFSTTNIIKSGLLQISM